MTIKHQLLMFRWAREQDRFRGLISERIAEEKWQAERLRQEWEHIWAEPAWLAMMEAQS